MENRINVGSNITIARKKIKMTQGELCKRVGISRPFLSNVENGIKNPSANTLEKIAEVLDVRVSQLINGFELEEIGDIATDARRKDRRGKNITQKINSIDFEKMPLSAALLLDETLKYIAYNTDDEENINAIHRLLLSINNMKELEKVNDDEIKNDKFYAFRKIEEIYDKLKH